MHIIGSILRTFFLSKYNQLDILHIAYVHYTRGASTPSACGQIMPVLYEERNKKVVFEMPTKGAGLKERNAPALQPILYLYQTRHRPMT